MRRHLWSLAAAAVLSPLLLPAVSHIATAASSSSLSPDQDPFYSYSGPPQPPGCRPSIKRSVNLALTPGDSTPVTAEQLLAYPPPTSWASRR